MPVSNAVFHELPTGPIDAHGIVTACLETDTQAVLLNELPADFMDLSSGLAGEVLHKLSTYRLRMAAVLPSSVAGSEYFQSFVREANRGELARFFQTRDEAVSWLEGTQC